MPASSLRPLAPIVAAAALLFHPGSIEAQTPTGRITGRVIDAATGTGITDVGIQVVGEMPGTSTSSGTMSGADGRYMLQTVRAGTVTLHLRRIGYQPKTVTGVIVPGGRAIEQDVTLERTTVQLSAVTVNAAAERGTVDEALDQQRNAAGVVSTVTAEQVAKSPDSDAAQAVQRVSGVTVQDGKYVFVRGLGERYTTTSLNGARLPSPEPERKVVPLDLFPSGVLQTITTAKTFTPDLSGDFSGASVDIRTREFPAQRQYAFSSSVGMSMGATGTIPGAAGVGGERFALAGPARDLPVAMRAAGDLANLSQADKNALIGSLRNVWQVEQRTVRPNTSFSASVGGNDPVAGHRVGYLVSATYSHAQEVRSAERRALARPGEGNAQVEYNRFAGMTGRQSAMLGGLFNVSTLLGTTSRLAFNNTYNRTADNDARIEHGLYEDFGNVPLTIQRLDYVERSIWSSQLLGEHTLGRQSLNWALTGAGVTRDQPDRSEFVYEHVADSAGERRLWVNTLTEGAVRTFAALDERSLEAKADFAHRFGAAETQVLKAGLLGRATRRDSDTRSYSIFAPVLDDEARALPLEQIIARYTAPDANVLSIRSLAQGGSYSADDRLTAGYAMLDVGAWNRLRITGGARLERSAVRVSAVNTIGEPTLATRVFTDVLPSLALTYHPTTTQNVRLSGSRTLARPEYREMAGIRTRDVLGGTDLRGNPELIRTLIDNADVRWEYYPNRGEVLSVALFAKRFRNPIERVFRPSNTNSIVELVNAESADNLGVELEMRKGLGFLANPVADFSVFTNATIMRSEIRLGGTAAGSTSPRRAMVGQAPYVMNAGLTWSPRRTATSATLLYNTVGQRIVHAGELPLPDAVERPRHVLDLSLRLPVRGSVAMRLDAKNLLDAPQEVRQGSVVREYHETGRMLQVGVSWIQ